jgi:hypothetical protein
MAYRILWAIFAAYSFTMVGMALYSDSFVLKGRYGPARAIDHAEDPFQFWFWIGVHFLAGAGILCFIFKQRKSTRYDIEPLRPRPPTHPLRR